VEFQAAGRRAQGRDGDGEVIGTITHVNPVRGMVAVKTEAGYSIFELLGDEPPAIGDEVRWKDDTALGGEMLENVTQGIRFEVYFQNHHVHPSHLRAQLRIAR
jgi:hypothetical protein